jgi:hypothetical protein
MLIGIEGNVGSGKTIYGVRCVKKDSDNGRKIVSNTPLIDIPFTTFNIDEFLDNKYNELLKNATVFIDEITVYMDCRLGSSKQNLLMGYLVLQSRKRGIDIYYTTQDLDLVDYKRLVKYTNIIVYAQEIFTKNLEGRSETIDNYRNYTVIDMRRKKDNITQFNMKITPYYKYYDTDYIITPMVKMNVKKSI